MTIFKALVQVSIGCMLIISGANGDDLSLSRIAQARKAFDDCVYNSVIAQLMQLAPASRPKVDISLAAEQAFVACRTEEQVLRALVSANISTPAAVENMLLGVRVQLKRGLQNVAANPAAYQKNPQNK